ncbi:hypothetical protein GCM10010441_57150 [Kitasatospora paracochleata]
MAARLYAGAVEARPMATEETRPSASVFRPFSPAPEPCVDIDLERSGWPGEVDTGPTPFRMINRGNGLQITLRARRSAPGRSGAFECPATFGRTEAL